VHDLPRLARDFAGSIQDLLNKTVCDGLNINAVVHQSRPEVFVGRGLTKQSLESRRFPVRRGRGITWCWLNLSFRLSLDTELAYLTVVSSFFGVYAEDAETSCLCHFDYERNKADGYPEAHLQVFGQSAALEAWGGRISSRGLDRLHFPVGGRRFRPCLEDVIEFLVAEKLATARDGWEQVIGESRQGFQRHQLRAAIRRDPETARQMLQELK
jgi:hypothetical protein